VSEPDFAGVEDVPEIGRSMPFGIKFLICFLFFDSLHRGIEIAHALGGMLPLPLSIYILWIVTNLLLIVLILLAARAGRWWTQAILLVHIFYIVHTIAIQEPYLWLVMDFLTRARTLLTVGIDAFFFAWLFSPKAKAWFIN
jgi:hypothetical protein